MKTVSCKVVMLGDSGVGKSCLVSRFIRNEFSEFEEPTIGAAYQVKELTRENDQTSVKLEIWDTAGQERYRSLTPMYYRGAKVALICFDITSEESFKGAASWLREISKKGPKDCTIFLVATKVDKTDEKVCTGKELAASENLAYFETSAKSGKNIDNLFRSATKHAKKDCKPRSLEQGLWDNEEIRSNQHCCY